MVNEFKIYAEKCKSKKYPDEYFLGTLKIVKENILKKIEKYPFDETKWHTNIFFSKENCVNKDYIFKIDSDLEQEFICHQFEKFCKQFNLKMSFTQKECISESRTKLAKITFVANVEAKPQTEFISGYDAWISKYQGKKVFYQIVNSDHWFELNDNEFKNWSTERFLKTSMYRFKLGENND